MAKINLKLSLFVSILLSASIAFASQNTPTTKEILENGLTVLIREEHSHPLATIHVTVGAGLSSEGRLAASGISHLVEHMIFKGTSKRKPGDVEKEVKAYGGEIAGWTGLDSTGYSITVPKEHAVEALLLMEDVIFNPVFEQAELKKEKEVVLKEINLNKDDPSRRVMRNLWQTSYIEHPYRMPLIGHEELFKQLERPDIVKYHSLRYASNNMILTVVGDVDRAVMLAEIEASFGKHERRMGVRAVTAAEPEQNCVRRSRDFAEINLGYLAMGYHTVGLSSKDLYGLDVLAIILGDWDGSRLNKKLVKEKQLLYTVSSFNYTPKYPGLFIVYGVGDYKKLENAASEIMKEIAEIGSRGIGKNELEAAKNMVISSYINSLETTQGLAKNLSQSEFLAGEPAFFEKYVENVKKLDMEAVREAAKKYLGENNLTVSYVYPIRSGDTDEKQPIPSPARNGSASAVELANGIRLILKEDHRIPKASLVCAFLGGVRAETKENNGISNLTASLLLKGTKNRREDRIKPRIESRGGQISHFSGKDSFGISMDFLSEEALDALDVLEDVVKNPSFPEEEIKKQKERLYAGIKAEDDDIYASAFLKLKKALFGNASYGLRIIGETDALSKISAKDIKDFYDNLAVPGNMVISLVGDFEPEKMRLEIEKRFSDMAKMHFQPEWAKPREFASINEVTHGMPREQSLILAGFRGADVKSKDRLYLEVLSSVLSGENGRLYESIRDKLGLSYALGTLSAPAAEKGYFASYVATDKSRLGEAKDILLKELRKAASGEISDKEIELAKKALIGRHKIALQSHKALAYQIALDELFGVGYDAYENYARSISEITPSDIAETSKKYIDLDNFAIVIISGK